MTAGILGELLTTFTTFLPSFMFIFAGAPYIEAITANKKLNAALTGISGAVVGVVLKIGVFFAVNTFFSPPRVLTPLPCALPWCRWWPLYAGSCQHALVGLSGVAGLLWQMIR